ncbi:MAG: aspartate--tRNA ligase [Pseudomonadaceae bacterium]|nr:aspartate--tRNA ligase [Pseudomonadaceae bacterium]
MTTANPYRSHVCGEMRPAHIGQTVKLAGWVFRRRDHGGVVFIDLRDNSGIVQVVFKPETVGADVIEAITHTGLESVIGVEGRVIARGEGLENPNMATGQIEIEVTNHTVLGRADPLPYALTDDSVPEELRLTYRFLDLRRDDVHNTIHLRSAVIQSIRKRMWDLGFKEFQTPILTASSPEGARDFLVPSRLHPGKFYALPQAPQQFKQLLMVGGFDRYFQIAPCFRDEDARADRCPTDFYQLDLEMSFPTQDEIFAVAENVIGGVFEEFKDWNGNARKEGSFAVTPAPWVRIPYDEAMAKYSSDKPDLRNPLVIQDCSDVWAASEFKVFKGIVESGGVVRMIGVPNAAEQPRSWFDQVGKWAQDELGAPAAPGYISLKDGEFKGPLTKFLAPEQVKAIFEKARQSEGGVVFFVAGKFEATHKILNPLRLRLGRDCGLTEQNVYKFCWIVDFPMFEKDEATGKIDFSHNPFSMPQGGLEALKTQDPLDIKAWQYDLVCNGYELISGGIRNHIPEAMIEAFRIAGLPAEVVKNKFTGLWKAFHYGTPPHGGCAAGLERVVMLLAESTMVREVVAFPMTQKGEDLLMDAPSAVDERQLKELHIQLRKSAN